MSINWTTTLLSEMRTEGLECETIEADGEFHRFGPKKCQWYVAHSKSGADGRLYYVASYGDWRTGLVKTKSSGLVKRASPEERARHRQIIDELKAEVEAKRLREQVSASEDALESFFSGDDSGQTQYMKRKGIDQLYGCRIRQADHALMVPMKSPDGFVGIQQIFDDGSKYFWPGQRTKGCFHLIGGVTESEIFLVEGFATGATVHRATGRQVAVAFSVHNLEDVALHLQSIGLRVTLCADNDQFTDGNPGLTAARKLESLGVPFVYPKFKDLSSKPTDFNDLELCEGMPEVTAQIYAKACIKIEPVRVGLFELPEEMGDDPGKQSEIAETLVEALRGRLFYDPLVNKWWGFEGRWQKCPESRIHNMIADAMGLMFPSGYSWGQLSAVIKLMTMRLSKPTPKAQRNLIPFQNGFLNIDTKEFHQHSVDVFIDWFIPCDRTDSEHTPSCDEVFHNLAGQDESNPEYKNRKDILICFLAATLRGMSSLQKFLELIGEPGSGKSTYMHLAKMLVGEENAKSSSLRALDKSAWETGTYYQKRLVVFQDESDWGGTGDLLKSLVGGDSMRNEEKYGRIASDFVFDGMVIVSANNYIQFADKSHALVRRRIPIKVERSINEAAQDRNIIERLRGEVPALINKLLKIDPSKIEETLKKGGGKYDQESVNSYLESNIVGSWMNECCESAPGCFSPTVGEDLMANSNGLYTNFQFWCDRHGIRNVPSALSFGKMMRSASKVLGWEIERGQEPNTSRRKGWFGVKVRGSVKI